jgi:hypothetical protein
MLLVVRAAAYANVIYDGVIPTEGGRRCQGGRDERRAWRASVW